MDKKYKNGLCLMKAYPPTKGHQFLIDSATKHCEVVHVMICSLKSETISGELRAQWLRDMYQFNPNVRIIHCTDENPQYPSECASLDEFYKSYWVPTVYKNIKELDVVFTSEDYGEEFAEYLGVKHIMVDKDRTIVPVSGTAVRQNALSNWHLIDKQVQRHFMKKVVVLGPESTGKSTLISNLARYFGANYVEEFGRTYTEDTGTDNLTLKDFENIVFGHIDSIQKVEPSKVVFIDTEAITTKIFAEMYLGSCDSDYINEAIDNQHFDLYLVLDIDVPWVDDGTRDFPEGREEHLARIKEILGMRNIPYTLISGDYQERFNKAIKQVEKLGYLL